MYCFNCGKQVDEGIKFCPYCGSELNNQPTSRDSGYQPIYQQSASYIREDDAPSIGFFILSLFIPIVGIILFAIWSKDYPLKAKSCLKGFVTGIVIYFVFVCCLSTAVGGLVSMFEEDVYIDLLKNVIQISING